MASLSARPEGDRVSVEIVACGDEPVSAPEIQEVREAAAWMLRLDEDLSGFHRLCEAKGGRWARLGAGTGRLLRSPTLFEDVVRTILTTNIQWSGTVRMVQALVDAFGQPFSGDRSLRAFPTPASIAAVSGEAFAEVVSLGYRGPYIHALASRVASDELILEALRDAELPSGNLKKQLLAIKGVGPYAAATLSMILGHYEELAVDTEFRQFVSRAYFGGSPVSDSDAAAVYDEWGPWKYLAYWFDVTGG
jgi:3-methyladenine DNA glycosylase/8-oxoguanine DNA glycosylase